VILCLNSQFNSRFLLSLQVMNKVSEGLRRHCMEAWGKIHHSVIFLHELFTFSDIPVYYSLSVKDLKK
jgi:hypothetical protein